MARISREDSRMNARIVYWGVEGSGKSENLRVVHRKLRPDHRGALEALPTRIDPTVRYEVLPIELGDVGGFRTAIEMVAVPGSADQASTRKYLLDQVDGVVLVIDSQPDRLDENAASLAELRSALSDYGRRLEEIPLVIQYNKRDLSDPYTLEKLHRRLNVTGAAVFEAVATEATGVLQTLSTLSKRVVRTLRDQRSEPAPPADDSVGRPEAFDAHEPVESDAAMPEELDRGGSDASERMEEAILAESSHPEAEAISQLAAETEDLFDTTWDPAAGLDAGSDPFAALDEPLESAASEPAEIGPEMSIASVGEASKCGERSVRVPIVVSDKQGRTSELVLTISLDALVDGDSG